MVSAMPAASEGELQGNTHQASLVALAPGRAANPDDWRSGFGYAGGLASPLHPGDYADRRMKVTPTFLAWSVDDLIEGTGSDDSGSSAETLEPTSDPPSFISVQGTADTGARIYRFDVWYDLLWGGHRNLRQEQASSGNRGGRPLRQRQNAGQTGGYPGRQRQNGN